MFGYQINRDSKHHRRCQWACFKMLIGCHGGCECGYYRPVRSRFSRGMDISGVSHYRWRRYLLLVNQNDILSIFGVSVYESVSVRGEVQERWGCLSRESWVLLILVVRYARSYLDWTNTTQASRNLIKRHNTVLLSIHLLHTIWCKTKNRYTCIC